MTQPTSFTIGGITAEAMPNLFNVIGKKHFWLVTESQGIVGEVRCFDNITAYFYGNQVPKGLKATTLRTIAEIVDRIDEMELP